MFHRLLTEPESEDVIDALRTYHDELAAPWPDGGEPEHYQRSRELLRDHAAGGASRSGAPPQPHPRVRVERGGAAPRKGAT